MTLIVVAISVFVVALGLYGVVSPAGLSRFVTVWRSRTGLWVAAVFRLVFGIALLFAAPSSRAPLTLEVLAVVSIAAGLILPLMGFARYESLLSWLQRQSLVFVRVWCLAAVVFGAFVLWSVAG